MRLDIFEAKRKKSYSKSEINNIVSEAQEAFWATVEEMVPEVNSADFSAGRSSKLDALLQIAVKKWIDGNTK